MLACWARIEKDERKFNHEVMKEKEKREEENLKKVQKKEETKKNFFPKLRKLARWIRKTCTC